MSFVVATVRIEDFGEGGGPGRDISSIRAASVAPTAKGAIVLLSSI